MVLQDVMYLEEMAHFDRERIPERVVHAKGAGAFGYFEVTSPEITKYCKAAIFNRVGKRTPMAARFSTVGGESGSADTVRDPRGFALKFYTEEGNWISWAITHLYSLLGTLSCSHHLFIPRRGTHRPISRMQTCLGLHNTQGGNGSSGGRLPL